MTLLIARKSFRRYENFCRRIPIIWGENLDMSQQQWLNIDVVNFNFSPSPNVYDLIPITLIIMNLTVLAPINQLYGVTNIYFVKYNKLRYFGLFWSKQINHLFFYFTNTHPLLSAKASKTVFRSRISWVVRWSKTLVAIRHPMNSLVFRSTCSPVNTAFSYKKREEEIIETKIEILFQQFICCSSHHL